MNGIFAIFEIVIVGKWFDVHNANKATQRCPCGYHKHPNIRCSCGPGQAQKYRNKISGPLLDRIDLHVEVQPVGFRELASEEKTEKSETIRARVIAAREIQSKRFINNPGILSPPEERSPLGQRGVNIR